MDAFRGDQITMDSSKGPSINFVSLREDKYFTDFPHIDGFDETLIIASMKNISGAFPAYWEDTKDILES